MLTRQRCCSGQLGVRDKQCLYRIAQSLADTPHSQEAVLEDNAGAGTAGRGHGGECLILYGWFSISFELKIPSSPK